MSEKPRLSVETITTWIGSTQSLALHTILFIGSFGASILGYIPWDRMLLVVTTLVSLEAIYLSIFIQMTVNRHSEVIQEVGEDIDEIQETVEELGDTVEDVQDTVEDIAEDSGIEQSKA